MFMTLILPILTELALLMVIIVGVIGLQLVCNMCLSPISIPNLNYVPDKYNIYLDLPPVWAQNPRYLKDVTHSYISVPCGRCAECRQRRQTQFVQRSLIQQLGFHCFMLTLTYSDDMIPSFSLQVSQPEGETKEETFTFADHRDIQNMFKLIRKYGSFNYKGARGFKYMCCSEYGGKRHRPHFHVLLYLEKLPSDFVDSSCKRLVPGFQFQFQEHVLKALKKYWSRNVGTNRKPVYKSLCRWISNPRKHSATYQCEYVHQKKLSGSAENDVAFYVSKYALKFDKYQNYLWKKLDSLFPDLVSFDPSRIPNFSSRGFDDYVTFRQLWNLLRPKIICSKFFGFSTEEQQSFIYDCVRKSLNNKESFAQFYNPVTGEHFGLSAYFRNKVLTPSDILAFYDNLPEDLKLTSYDTSHLPDLRFSSGQSEHFSKASKVDKYDHICAVLRERYSSGCLSSDPVYKFERHNIKPNYDFERTCHSYICPSISVNYSENPFLPLIFEE